MIIDEAIDVLRIEAKGILNLIDRIDQNFEQMHETHSVALSLPYFFFP